MAGEQYRLSIIVSAEDLASGKLGKVKSELQAVGSSSKGSAAGLATAAGGMARVEKTAGRLGGALSHARSSLGSLISGPLGLIGLGAGLFTVGGALAAGVGKAEDMALAVEKLTAVTGLNAHAASQVIAVNEKYGVSSEMTIKSAGIAEKVIGKLATTQGKAVKSTALLALENQKLSIGLAGGKTKVINAAIAHQKLVDAQTAHAGGASALTAIDQKYGLHLVDAKGKVADYASELSQLADLEINKKIPASQKDVLLAQLLGKSYVGLLPALKLGSKGMAEAAAEADKLGLTLKSAEDVKNVHDFIAAQRDAKDSLAGLEMQFGLIVMPDLAKGFRSFTTLVADNKTQIIGAFHDALGVAKQVFTAVVQIGGAFKTAWDLVPGPLKQLLITGFVANKALKMTIGFDPLKIATGGIAGALKGLIGGFFGRGAPGNPMYTIQEGLPGKLPIPGGPAIGAAEGAAAGGIGEGGLLALFGGAAGIAALVGIFAVAAIPLVTAKVTGPDGHWKTHGRGNNEWIPNTPGSPTSALASPNTPGGLGEGGDKNLGSVLDRTKSALVDKLALIHQDLIAQTGVLKSSKDPKALAAAAKAMADDFIKGAGNIGNTRDTATDLRSRAAAAKKAGDAVLAKAYNDAAARIESKLPGREWVAKELQQGQRIVASNETVAQKVADLKGLQAQLLTKSDTVAAATIAAAIDALIPHIDAISLSGPGGVTRTVAAQDAHTKGTTDIYTVVPRRKQRAGGGSVHAGESYTVGERGIERLTMYPDGGGYVTPSSESPLDTLGRLIFGAGPEKPPARLRVGPGGPIPGTPFRDGTGVWWASKADWIRGTQAGSKPGPNMPGGLGEGGHYAAGLLGMSQGTTSLPGVGVFGEAGKEAVAIVKAPRAIGSGLPVRVTNWPSGSGGSGSGSGSGASGGSGTGGAAGADHFLKVNRHSAIHDAILMRGAVEDMTGFVNLYHRLKKPSAGQLGHEATDERSLRTDTAAFRAFSAAHRRELVAAHVNLTVPVVVKTEHTAREVHRAAQTWRRAGNGGVVTLE